MTRTTAYNAPHGADTLEWLPGLDEAAARLHWALVLLCGPSRRAVVDLAQIGRDLRLRPLTRDMALLVLRTLNLVAVRHSPDRFETATITLPPVEVSP